MGIFTHKISISADVDQFAFSSGERYISLRTVVFLAKADSNQILSIGVAPQDTEFVAVHLFDGVVGSEDKFELLTAFLRFGLREVGVRSFRSPAITFSVTPGLVVRLAGFHQMLLSEAARRAGAISVAYENMKLQ